MLAKAAASLDLLSGGRFELGLGAGASMRAVTAMGGPPQRWADTITHLVRDLRFDTIVFWPEAPTQQQLSRFTEQVIPAVGDALTAT